MNSTFLLAISTLLLCCGLIRADLSGPPKSWLTQCDVNSGNALLLLEPQQQQTKEKTDVDGKKVTITLSPTIMKQQMEGYGAGLPQASASVLYKLKQSNLNLYNYVLTRLFGPPNEDDNNAMGMNMLRFPIGSCDFSMTNTSYDEVKDDFNLEHFHIDADSQQYIVEVLKDAKKVNPSLHLIASPWSAPSWMKVMQTLLGMSNTNTLLDDDKIYQTYANYFVRVLESFEAQGLHINYLTLQNEPLFGDSHEYPGMYLSSEQELRLAKLLFPMIQEKNVKLLGYDHNWDHPEYPQYLLSDANSPFAGTAWHCYGGDMSTAHDMIHKSFPTKEQHVTECTGGYPNDKCDISQGMTGFGYNHEWDMNNLFLGAAGHWATSGVKWILALDENCGPTLPLVSFKNGRPLVAIPSDAKSENDIQFNQDFWTIGHMSKFIARGSYHIDSTMKGANTGSLLSESFVDKVQGVLTTMVMNRDHQNSIALLIKDNANLLYEDIVPPFSTKVYRWQL